MAAETLAGRYELVSLFWEEPISKPGEPYNFVRHVRGDLVDLDDENARRLLAAGAVVEPGSRERAAAMAAKAQYEAALAALPDSVKAELDAERQDAADTAAAAALDLARAGSKPVQAAPKTTWEAYGLSQGLDQAKLTAASKADIVAAFREGADAELLDALRADAPPAS